MRVCVRTPARAEPQLLTSVCRTSALNVYMASLSVFLQRASLLVTATAVRALEGLLNCEQRVSVKDCRHERPEWHTDSHCMISFSRTEDE